MQVAASSRDVRATLRVTIEGERPPADGAPAVYSAPARGQWFDRASFEALLGHEIGENRADVRGEFDDNTPLRHLGKSRGSAKIRDLIAARFGSQLGDDLVAQVMIRATLDDAPLRVLRMFGGGKISRAMTDAFLLAANGRTAEAVTSLWSSRRPSGG